MARADSDFAEDTLMRPNAAEHTTQTGDAAAVRTLLHYATVSDCRRELSAAAVRRQIPQSEVRINTRRDLDKSRRSMIIFACQQSTLFPKLKSKSMTSSTMRRTGFIRPVASVGQRRRSLGHASWLNGPRVSPKPSWTFSKSISLTSWTRYSTQRIEFTKGGVA